MKKVLIAAKALDPNRTSEGICSSKFVGALTRAGYDVVCLTTEALPEQKAAEFTLPWLGPARIKRVRSHGKGNAWTRLYHLTEALASKGSAGAFASRKIKAVFAYASGHDPALWHEVDLWSQSIRHEVETWKPELIFIRGAGTSFEPYMAMLNWRSPVPWIANYHDPYPVSLYPEPYRITTPVLARWQEALHRRIVTKADGLTFPSRRLLEWVLKDGLEEHRRKASVIPHLATGLHGDDDGSTPDGVPALPIKGEDFNIMHTGTLLGPRQPWTLWQGFQEFIAQSPEKRERARLIFIGKINPKHRADARFESLSQCPNVVLTDQRLSYQQTLGITELATAAVVLEANAPESPFFPAKLSDYLGVGKPILALTSHQSVLADLVGTDYKLLVAPDDSQGVTNALNALWDCWKEGRLHELVAPQRVLDMVSEEAVVADFEQVLNRVAPRTASSGEPATSVVYCP